MRVLLSGGAGFIEPRLAGRGHEVVGVDDLSTGGCENVPVDARFYEIDVRSGRDLAEAFAAFRPEVLCHQAAQMDVRR
ncbi:MAG TPA: NAD-dependent epimerase/dehydratase family protein [Rubrobacter sp.]|nr:NAD-dependent epimerase/dehydratase family protein [Rubrobacter sp.]